MRASVITGRSIASRRTSLRQARAYSAWKRRFRGHLATLHRLRWSYRTLSTGVPMGVFGSCDHALALTSRRRRDQSRVPSLNRLSPASTVLRTPRTPARHGPLSPSAYRNRQRPTWAAGTGLSCSAPSCVRMPSPIPRERPAPLRKFWQMQSVAFAVT